MDSHHTIAVKTQSPVPSPRPQSLLPEESPVDPRHARFPYCLVWTPLPIVAWLVPFIGHVGICQTNGVILDFAGPFFVNVDNFAFGATARFHRLDPKKVSKSLAIWKQSAGAVRGRPDLKGRLTGPNSDTLQSECL